MSSPSLTSISFRNFMVQLINWIYITIWRYLHQHRTLFAYTEANQVIIEPRQNRSIYFCSVIPFQEEGTFSKRREVQFLAFFIPFFHHESFPSSPLLSFLWYYIPSYGFWNLFNSTLSQMTPIYLYTYVFHSLVLLICSVSWCILSCHSGKFRV